MKYDLTTPAVTARLVVAREQLEEAKRSGAPPIWVEWYEYVIRGLEEVLAVNADLDAGR